SIGRVLGRSLVYQRRNLPLTLGGTLLQPAVAPRLMRGGMRLALRPSQRPLPQAGQAPAQGEHDGLLEAGGEGGRVQPAEAGPRALVGLAATRAIGAAHVLPGQ